MPIRLSPMKLDRANAIVADIYCWEDGKPWSGPTWPSEDGTAIILCPDCGEIDEKGEFFEPSTVYSNMGSPGDNDAISGRHKGCNVCKSNGFMRVGL